MQLTAAIFFIIFAFTISLTKGREYVNQHENLLHLKLEEKASDRLMHFWTGGLWVFLLGPLVDFYLSLILAITYKDKSIPGFIYLEFILMLCGSVLFESPLVC